MNWVDAARNYYGKIFTSAFTKTFKFKNMKIVKNRKLRS